ncbi:uncharacterized protein EKO05_0007295 [Ascochyta rabiei]|uniref:uncharacterized protein n=1 Tax=Didymella rabiei TaxID=5454 RepID=UPI0018FFF16D|nr:uncharacterized protein EKO05_0007295 [Ascochyta rabiei]UPX16914.1 hypothetical protein EKO05_0007295 [Ascochyta rabiei]
MNKATPRAQAIADKISTLLKPHRNVSPVVSPPAYNDDHQHRSVSLASVVSLMLLLLLSIPTLALKAYSYSFIESNAEMGFYLVNNGIQGMPESGSLVAALPHNIFRVPEKLVLIVAMLNVLLSTAHLAFIAWDWKVGRKTQTRVFRRIAMVVHIINAILVLTALVAILVSHKASSLFNYELIPNSPNAVSPSGYKYYRYDAGTFDLETWTCELESPDSIGEARKDYKAQCDIEVAGRTILVPFFLVAVAIAGVSICALVVGGRQESQSEHLWTKDVDLEMNKGNIDDKYVRVEEVELETLERPERRKNGRLSKIEEDEQEAEEVPNKTAAASESIISGVADPLPSKSKDAVARKTDGAA